MQILHPARQVRLGASLGAAVLIVACQGPGAGPSLAAPVSSSTPTHVPAPVVVAADRAPLTDLVWSGDLATRSRTATVVAIGDGSPTGLSAADLVFQELDGSGRQHLLAVYQSQLPGRAGPLDDLRASDVSLLAVLHPGLAYAAARPSVSQELHQQAAIVDLSRGRPLTNSAYQEAGGQLFVDTGALSAASAGTVAVQGVLAFTDDVAPLTLTANAVGRVIVGVTSSSPQTWTYDPTLRRYTGIAASFGTFEASNLVVQYVNYRTTADRHDDGSHVLSPGLFGRGRCVVFSRGTQSDCAWIKAGADSVTSYTDPSGVPLRLSPGQTWIAMVPETATVQAQPS